MGGFYGSVQVRSDDRQRVKAAAEEVARAKKIQCLVGPVMNGWVGIFPEHNGQDQAVGRQIAGRLHEDVLHLMVHDDDVFAYWLYRDGQPIDSYWSAPGYFGQENRAAEEKMAGDPEAFRPILGERIKKLPALLARDDGKPAFASGTLAEFARVLRIANAVTAYEYLKAGERDGVKGWRQFEEVPAEQVRARADAKRRERDLTTAERQRLTSAGVLLLTDEHKQEMPQGCSFHNGFLVAWPDFRSAVSFSTYQQPGKEPRPVALHSTSHVAGPASDATGKRIAIASGDRVSVWAVPQDINDGWIHVADVSEHNLAVGVAISPDGTTIAHASRERIVVTEITGPRRVMAFPSETRQRLAFHPGEEWAAASGTTLGLISLRQEPHMRELYVGGKVNVGSAFGALLQSKMRDVDLVDVEKRARATMDATLSMLRKGSRRHAVSDEQIDEMRRQMEKSLEESRSRLIAWKEGQLPPVPAQGREQVRCVGFTRDGRWMWCGTNAGLRIYEWSSVPRQPGADMPRPAIRLQLPGEPEFDGANQVHDVAEEVDAPALVFGGGTGRLYRLDLATGETRELLKLPGQVAIYGLSMSVDGKTLGVATCRTPSRLRALGPKDQRNTWSVWSYTHLRGPFMRP